MSTNNAIIHHIGLKNFKGYQEADIPLAPITLFFGPNSAGKSTVFQVLYLIKQTLQYAPKDVPLLFRCDNGYVDLGSFEDVVFDHDSRKAITIQINEQTTTFKKIDDKVIVSNIEIDGWEFSESDASEYVNKSRPQPDPDFYQYSPYRIVYNGGEHRYIKTSPFYKWVYTLLHSRR